MALTHEQVLDEFRAAGALLEGHFILSSGLHSPRYLQCARVLMDPARAARLWYRRVDQSARWQSAELSAHGRTWRGDIPAAYTDSPYPLQYYVALTDAAGRARLWPGFTGDLSNQPCVVLRRG